MCKGILQGIQLTYLHEILASESCRINLKSCYRPQTKFAQVMFSQVSVILSTGGVVCIHRGGCLHPSRGLHPGDLYPRGPHPGGLHPGGGLHRREGLGRLPSPIDIMGYDQRAGGTHPIGMHSCLTNVDAF